MGAGAIHWALAIMHASSDACYRLQMEEIRESIMECSDARVKAISELLAGIKAIKLYAWETPWAERISGLREKELAQIKREAMLNIIGSLLWLAVRCFILCTQSAAL